MKNLKNILLTGGAGYIGSHVTLHLIDQGYNVTVVDNLITGHKGLIPKKAEFIECDFSDEKMIKSLLSKKKFAALTTAFKPPQSPPLVNIPILLICISYLISLVKNYFTKIMLIVYIKANI